MADPTQDRRDHGGRVDPGHGQVPHRPLRRGADPPGAGRRLHRRERGAHPGRRGAPLDKWAFKVPFVCGARDLGEALRRIGEGAAMIRTKGEAGTGDVVEAVRHMRKITGQIRALARPARRRAAARGQGARRPATSWCAQVAATGHAAGRELLRRGHRHARRRRADDAARRRRRLRRVGHLQVRGPGAPAPGPSSRRPPTTRTPTSWPRSPAAWASRCAGSTRRQDAPRRSSSQTRGW